MAEPVKTVIGFDFGSHCIGVAVGQTLTGQASPLTAVKSKDWYAIGKILLEWQPQLLVVGLPLNMLGEQQEMSKRAERFCRQLEGRFGIPTRLVDERLTTREAHQLSLESRRKKSKPEIDSLAAALITESWLRDYAASE
ncbi:MAG: Holliday junction resolvase RuvX [Gammaproteobacteria bacterium]